MQSKLSVSGVGEILRGLRMLQRGAVENPWLQQRESNKNNLYVRVGLDESMRCKFRERDTNCVSLKRVNHRLGAAAPPGY